MKNRVILVFINLVFILSFFIPLFHDIARAADFPEPYIPSEDTKEQAKKEQYARILFVCMTVDSKSGGEWLPYQKDGENGYNDEKYPLGAWNTKEVGTGTTGLGGDDRKAHCYSLSRTTVLSMLNTIGFSGSTLQEIYCGIDYAVNPSKKDEQCSGDGSTLDLDYRRIAYAITEKADLTDAMKYLIAYQIITESCGAENKGILGKDIQEVDKDSKKDFNISLVTDPRDGQESEVYVFRLKDNNKVTLWSKNDGNLSEAKCQDLIMQRMVWAKDGSGNPTEQDLVSKYVEYVKEHLPGGSSPSAPPGTCEEKYKDDEKLKAACADGYNHKGEEGYCAKTYKDAELEACNYGAETATGATGTTPGVGAGDPEEKQEKECKIEEGVGWIVCPVINFLASINDFAYQFISKTFLETSKDLVQSDGLKAAWGSFRDIANTAFVIAFLIIVYSQITQAGISNYGIKRMLPRLFIAALLVNASYTFCLLAVDLSNTLGYSLAGLFDGFAVGTGEENVSVIKQAGSTLITWVTVAAAVLAAAAGIALAFLGPALMSSLLALLMIVLILVARKALIVILIAISPVAFVAYLLPNTEQWFKKWQKTFMALLMVFPMVGVVFGGSRLAAKIIANAAGEEDWMLQATALAVAAVPFFIVPSLLQKSMEATGTLGAKLTGLSQAANKRAGKAVKERSALGRYKQAWDLNRKQKQAQIFAGQYKGGKHNFLANAASRGFNKFNQGKHGPFKGTRQAAGQQAAELVKKLNIDKVEAAKAQIEQANLDSAALAKLASGQSVGGISGSDTYARVAATSAALDRGDHEAVAAGWDSVAEADQSTRSIFADAMSASDSRPAWMTAGEIAEMRSAEDSKTKDEGPTVTKADGSKSGIHKYDEMATEQIKQNVYSPQRMAAASRQELEYARKVTSNDPEAQQKLKDTAEKVVGDEKLSRGLGKNSEAIQGLANLTVTTPSSSTPPPPAAPPAASGGGSSASTPPSRGFTPRGSGRSGRGR